MGSRRLQWKWCDKGTTGSPATEIAVSTQVIPLGTRASIYQAAVIRGGKANYRTGGVAGTILDVTAAEAAGSDRDPMDNAGGHIEFPDGVYIEVIGDAYAAGVLVDCGEDP